MAITIAADNSRECFMVFKVASCELRVARILKLLLLSEKDYQMSTPPEDNFRKSVPGSRQSPAAEEFLAAKNTKKWKAVTEFAQRAKLRFVRLSVNA